MPANLDDPRTLARLKRIAETSTDEQPQEIIAAIKDKKEQQRVRQIMNAVKKPVA